jgi:hypothetical protein
MTGSVGVGAGRSRQSGAALLRRANALNAVPPAWYLRRASNGKAKRELGWTLRYPKLAARLPRGVCGIVRVEANAIRTQPNAGAGPNRVLREPRRGWVYGAATRALTCMHALGWTRAGTTGSSGSLGSM